VKNITTNLLLTTEFLFKNSSGWFPYTVYSRSENITVAVACSSLETNVFLLADINEINIQKPNVSERGSVSILR
jgi:hypothetical protein